MLLVKTSVKRPAEALDFIGGVSKKSRNEKNKGRRASPKGKTWDEQTQTWADVLEVDDDDAKADKAPIKRTPVDALKVKKPR